MNNKVFVGSLSFNTDQGSLTEYFSTVGAVTKVNIITDKMTGKSKGFGFVEYATEAEAQAAVLQFAHRSIAPRSSALAADRHRRVVWF